MSMDVKSRVEKAEKNMAELRGFFEGLTGMTVDEAYNRPFDIDMFNDTCNKSFDEFMNDALQNSKPLAISPPRTINQTSGTEKISIRIPHSILTTIKEKAAARAIPYQTFINLLLVSYVTGQQPA